jgi:hypothetical protein
VAQSNISVILLDINNFFKGIQTVDEHLKKLKGKIIWSKNPPLSLGIVKINIWSRLMEC